uniref:Uncharacterized protein n=1 Tax=Arundo donax TaxID=35708 RepID=A0A0A9CVS1_ARUDO
MQLENQMSQLLLLLAVRKGENAWTMVLHQYKQFWILTLTM